MVVSLLAGGECREAPGASGGINHNSLAISAGVRVRELGGGPAWVGAPVAWARPGSCMNPAVIIYKWQRSILARADLPLLRDV